jgi:hypothetical protein
MSGSARRANSARVFITVGTALVEDVNEPFASRNVNSFMRRVIEKIVRVAYGRLSIFARWVAGKPE